MLESGLSVQDVLSSLGGTPAFVPLAFVIYRLGCRWLDLVDRSRDRRFLRQVYERDGAAGVKAVAPSLRLRNEVGKRTTTNTCRSGSETTNAPHSG